jgi:gluconolactonase
MAPIFLPLAVLSSGPDIIAPGATLERLATGFSFTEGPATDRVGNVYFTDQPNDRIVKWNVSDGSFADWLKPCGRSNGTRFDAHGNLITCSDEHNQLWSIAPDKTVTVLIKDFQGTLMNGPNDVWIRPDGGMYITDPLYPRPYWSRDPKSQLSGQHVYWLAPGAKELKQVTDDLSVPNGIVGTPDGKTLYVGDLGQNKTFRYHIQPDGTLTNKTFFCPLGSDGMTIDNRGDIYLTGHGVTVFDKTGAQIAHIDVPEAWTGNIKFGGKGHRMLFITASTSVYGLKMNVHGFY